jgi:hypothetical protein
VTALAAEPVQARTIDPNYFRWLSDAISARHPELDRPAAEATADQTMAFLLVCAAHPNRVFVPSDAVDEGWHAALEEPDGYRQFFERHGLPCVRHTAKPAAVPPLYFDLLPPMLDAIRGLGLFVDPGLWPQGSRADCADEGNCSASGKDGDENTNTRIPGP